MTAMTAQDESKIYCHECGRCGDHLPTCTKRPEAPVEHHSCPDCVGTLAGYYDCPRLRAERQGR